MTLLSVGGEDHLESQGAGQAENEYRAIGEGIRGRGVTLLPTGLDNR